jgi:pantothenate kinase
LFVGLAGVPGSGKSTVSNLLLQEFSHLIAVVPMDGYHYTRENLRSFADPTEAFRRRGAPFTFDAASFAKDVAQLRSTGRCSYPSFDHALKDPVPDSIVVDLHKNPHIRMVIFEGLYVYLPSDGFEAVLPLLDCKWFVDCPVDVAMDRVARRHVEAGIELNMQDAEKRVDANDRINAVLVHQQCRPLADWVFEVQR